MGEETVILKMKCYTEEESLMLFFRFDEDSSCGNSKVTVSGTWNVQLSHGSSQFGVWCPDIHHKIRELVE